MKLKIVILYWLFSSCVRGDFQKDIIAKHNEYRGRILNGTERRTPKAVHMPNLQYHEGLARKAQEHADRCEYKHDGKEERAVNGFQDVGQNIFYTTFKESNSAAADSWYNEIKDYNYWTSYCHNVCTHYTQMVWAKTEYIGCARQMCKNFQGRNMDADFVVCNYGEQGNWMGEKPYINYAIQSSYGFVKLFFICVSIRFIFH